MARQLPCPTKSSAYASLAQRESISLTRRGLGYRNSHGAPHMGHGDAQGVYRTCNAEIRREHYPHGPPCNTIFLHLFLTSQQYFAIIIIDRDKEYAKIKFRTNKRERL